MLEPEANGMEIDEINPAASQSQEAYNQKSYGTKRYYHTFEPTVPSPTTLNELYEEYKKYSLLQKKDSMMSNIESGTVSYLLSC